MELHDRNLNHLGFAIIDEEDYIKVKDYNWTIDKEGCWKKTWWWKTDQNV